MSEDPTPYDDILSQAQSVVGITEMMEGVKEYASKLDKPYAVVVLGTPGESVLVFYNTDVLQGLGILEAGKHIMVEQIFHGEEEEDEVEA